MSNVRISQLPTAPSAITGAELVPIVQNGQTVQTTVSSIISSPSLTQTFLTATNQTSLPNSRYLSATTGIGITDNGAQSTLQLTLNGTSGSLEASGYGIIAKTNTNTIAPITITAGTGGLSISNGNGVSGNPTVSLTGAVLAMAAVTGTGILTSSAGGTSIGTTTISGTANQIAVTNGNSAPVIGLASNAVLPGTASITLPAGATAARPGSPTNGMIRYNTDTATLEAYANSSWGAIVSGSGVATFSAGSTGLTPSTATSGGVVLGGTLNASSGGTGASGTLTGYVYGNGTSAMTASTTIPTTSLSGTITNAQLANSSFTINSTSISLGGTSTITAVNPYALTIGTGLSGTSYNGSSAVTVAIASTGVSAGTYGSGLAVPQITVNAQGQITGITTIASGSNTYQGTWNASTNSPTLTSSVGTNGYYYVVSVAGTTTLNGISLWSVGDWVVFNGSVWQKVNGSSSEAFTAITVTGLTGYMYANGTSQVTSSTTIPTSALSGVLATTNGGTGLSSFTSGGAVYATSTSALTTGTLPVTAGGTGIATLTAGYIPYGNGTSAFASNSGFTFSGSTLTAPVLIVNSTTSTTPNLTFNASNSGFTSGAAVSGSYLQTVIQNSSGTAGASTNYVLSNDLGTDSTYYGEFGMNSSVYSGASVPTDFFSVNNGLYFSGHDGDITVGSGNGKKLYFAWGSSGQYAHVINVSGAIGLNTNLAAGTGSGTTNFGTAGQVMTSQGSSATPTWGPVAGGGF